MEYFVYDNERKGFVESVGKGGILYTPDLDKAFPFPDIRAARDVFDNLVEEGWMLATHEYKCRENEPKGVDRCLKEMKEKWARGESIRNYIASSGTKRTRRASRGT